MAELIDLNKAAVTGEDASPVADKLAAYVAQPYGAAEVPGRSAKRAGGDLVGPGLQPELVAQSSGVELLLAAELGGQSEGG